MNEVLITPLPLAEDTTQRTIIEVQHIREDDFFDRFLYYHIISGEQIELYPHRLIFLGLRSVNEQTPLKVRPWRELIADSLDSQVDEANYDSDLFRAIIERMKRHTLSPEELSVIKDEAAWKEDNKKEKRRVGKARLF